MKSHTELILKKLTAYLKKYPDIRFGQALFNLDINQFEPQQQGMIGVNQLRDIYNDSDKSILKRMK